MFKVKLKTDISGGYGTHKKDAELSNLTEDQANTLYQSGLSTKPAKMAADAAEVPGTATQAEAVTGGKGGKG